MTLRTVGSGLTSRPRNLELVLLMASVGFAALGWRALEAASFPLAEGSDRILTQFAITAVAGHVALRFVAPTAEGRLYAVAALLSAVGLVFVMRLAPNFAQDQANWFSLGVALMVVTAAAGHRYRILRRYKYTAAAVAIFALFLTGIFGTTINGARLWIVVAGQSIQTTELIKLFLVIFLAGYLADHADILASPRIRFAGRTYTALPYIVPLAVTWLLAVAALALLRDLGSVALLLLFAVSVLFVATGRLRFVTGGAALLALTAFAGYFLFDHAATRIDTWLHPFEVAEGSGYQTVQSLFAIQAGGVTGAGPGMGDPTVIPAAPTDYVFASIAEELGLAGGIGVVALFGLFVMAGLRVAVQVGDDFGRLLACAIALLIGIQAAIIIAGNLRIVPTTGITLPFVSYGGSSLVVNFVLLGLLLGISDAAQTSRETPALPPPTVAVPRREASPPDRRRAVR